MTSEQKDLPIELIRAILLCFPLQDRIPMRIICHQWKDIIEDTFLNVRSLKLFDSYCLLSTYYCPLLLDRNLENDPNLALNSSSSESDDLVLCGSRKFYEFHDFVEDIILDRDDIPRTDRTIPEGHFLVNIFPNVEKLVVCFSQVPSRIDVFHLLTHYAPQLTSLGVFKQSSCYQDCKFEDSDSFPFDEIHNLIYSMPHLTSLYLGRFMDFITPTNMNEPKLLALEKLSIEQLYKETTEYLFQPSSSNLKHLNANILSKHGYNVFNTIANRNGQLAGQLESLSINFICFEDNSIIELVESICSHFVSLQSLHLNLKDEISLWEEEEDDVDQRKTPKFIFTQLARLNKLTNISFRIESKFFNISSDDLATVPIMKNIQNVTIELGNAVNCNIYSLERFLFVIFPNAVRIVLRTYYRTDTRWNEASRDRLVEMVRRNAPLVQLDRSEVFEHNLVPLLGRHAEHFRRDDVLRPYEMDVDDDGDDSYESELEGQSDSDSETEDDLEKYFMGVPVELLTLLSNDDHDRFDDIFQAGDQLKMIVAFERILEKKLVELNRTTNYTEIILKNLHEILLKDATTHKEQLLCLRSIDGVSLLASNSYSKFYSPNSFSEFAKSWIAILLQYFAHKNVSQDGFTEICECSLNLALDEIYGSIPFDVMLSQIDELIKHESPSVRKATVHFISRVLSENEGSRLKYYYDLSKGYVCNPKIDILSYLVYYSQLETLLKEAIEEPNEIEEIRNSLRLASIELDKIRNVHWQVVGVLYKEEVLEAIEFVRTTVHE